jgi:hypothetical protein
MTGPGALGNLYKVSFSGLISTTEQFVYSLWTTSSTVHDQEAVADNYTGDVADLLATTVSGGGVPTLESAFPDYVSWDQIKVSPWDQTTDKLESGQTPAYRTISENGNGSAGSGLPGQCALAITTRSALAGRRKYNRFYLPPLTIQATDGDGVLGAQEADAFVLWRHLNITSHAAAGDNQVNYNPHFSGNTHTIVDIYLGRRLDVIRRRANKQPEVRVIDAL